MAGNKKPAKPFVKGDPRINRKGRPKVGLTVAERIRDAMNEPVKEGDAYTKFDQLVDEAMRRAKNGHFQFFQSLMARAYGNVPDQVQMLVEKPPDLSKLSNLEVETLLKLMEKAKAD